MVWLLQVAKVGTCFSVRWLARWLSMKDMFELEFVRVKDSHIGILFASDTADVELILPRLDK
jgi:hypothetical protein